MYVYVYRNKNGNKCGNNGNKKGNKCDFEIMGGKMFFDIY